MIVKKLTTAKEKETCVYIKQYPLKSVRIIMAAINRAMCFPLRYSVVVSGSHTLLYMRINH